MKTQLKSLIILLLSAAAVFAQPPDTLWTRTFGGFDADYGKKVIQTDDGGFALLGYTFSFTNGGSDIYLIRTDASGDTLWTRNYGGSSDDIPGGFCQTPDGGFILGAATYSFNAVISDYYLIKTDAYGDTMWTKVIMGDDEDYCTDICPTEDGGYILAGFSSSSASAGADDAVLLKTDGNGTVEWIHYYGGESSDKAYCVRRTSDGGYIAAGESGSFVLYDPEAYLVRTDANGDTLWTRSYGMPYYYLQDVFDAVLETDDGGFIAVGSSCSFSFGYFDIFLVKTDANGDTLWTKLYGGEWDDAGLSFAAASDGGYIIAGTTKIVEGPFNDGYLVKINAQGDMLWTSAYGGSSEQNDDLFYSVIQADDGRYIIAGHTDAFGEGNYDIWMVCLEAESVYVENRLKTTPQLCFLYQPYPNPCNQSVNILFNLNAPGYVRLTVYDLAGREVGKLLEGNYSPGSYRNTFDASALSSGVYFIRMEAGDIRQTQKILLLR